MGRKYDFELQYLKNQLEHEGPWWFVLLNFSCSFIWAQLVLNPKFPFNRSHSENPIRTLETKCDQTSKKLDFLIMAKERNLTKIKIKHYQAKSKDDDSASAHVAKLMTIKGKSFRAGRIRRRAGHFSVTEIPSFCVADFATLSEERMLNSKFFLLFNTDRRTLH